MIKTVLPSNATALEVALDTNNAKRFDDLMGTTRESAKTWSADDCPAPLLPFLAWALSVDTWNPDWTEKVKRQVIASSVFVHRLKGTRASIDAALKALDLGVSISEWFEHGGEPYTFRADVHVTTRGITAQEIKDIFATIAATKNARSYLESLRIYLSSNLSTVNVFVTTMVQPLVSEPWLPELGSFVSCKNKAIAAHMIQPIFAEAYYD